MVVVHARNAETLIPIIVKHVTSGSIIHTDEWAAYNGLANAVDEDGQPITHAELSIIVSGMWMN